MSRQAPLLRMASRLILVVVAPSILLSGCYITASRRIPPEVASTCPDLSGAYFFPGREHADGVCSVLDSSVRGGSLRYPHPEGAFAVLSRPAIIVLDQQDCTSLSFHVIHLATERPIVREAQRDLTRRHRRKRVEWGEISLTYSNRVKPLPSFTLAPVNVARETIFLREEVSGGITYKAWYWELTEGKRLWTDCTLPAATEEHWRSVGVEELRSRFTTGDADG